MVLHSTSVQLISLKEYVQEGLNDSMNDKEAFNLDIKQIEFWARKNKIKFNDTKSKVLLVTRKKNIENKETNIYLNNRTKEQVSEMKYLRIYLKNSALTNI